MYTGFLFTNSCCSLASDRPKAWFADLAGLNESHRILIKLLGDRAHQVFIHDALYPAAAPVNTFLLTRRLI